MKKQGLIDFKGELFGFRMGNEIYTLDGEKTGVIDGRFVLDLRGSPRWQIMGDAVYTLKYEPVGYFGTEYSGHEADWNL